MTSSRGDGARLSEASLYRPVKRFLESLGYEVKGEVGGCDLVGLKGGDAPVVVIGEMKLSFSFELVLQGVDRAATGDEVWLAARLSKRAKGRESDRRFRALCRRLGFGLLGVASDGQVHCLLSPAAPPPRRDPRRRSALVEEHRRRQGDPVAGGGSRSPIMTAYRQRALACAAALAQGQGRPRDLKAAAADAPAILLRNVYGWFVRTERGVYALTEAGRSGPAALAHRAAMTPGASARGPMPVRAGRRRSTAWIKASLDGTLHGALRRAGASRRA